MSDAPKSAAAPAHRRSAKNYLLDRNFQLKYAGILAGTALVISAALFGLLWQTSSEVIVQGQKTVERGQKTVESGQKTVERGQEVIVQSRRVSQVVSMNIAKEYKDDPALAKTFGEEAAKDEQKLKDEQDRLVREQESLVHEQESLERDASFLADQQRRLVYALVAILGALVVALGMVGIVFTHKVAGPIYKMKRLLREVGAGKLVVRERLRKGDELQHFFETFEGMVAELRKRQEAEIARVDTILDRLVAAPVSARGGKELDEDGIEMLRKLRREMQDQLDA